MPSLNFESSYMYDPVVDLTFHLIEYGVWGRWGLIHGRSFPFQKLVLNTLGLIVGILRYIPSCEKLCANSPTAQIFKALLRFNMVKCIVCRIIENVLESEFSLLLPRSS